MSRHDTIIVEQAEFQERLQAEAALERIVTLRIQTEDNFFDLCDALLEVIEKGYHVHYGFGRFADWVEMASGLDMSARQAFYMTTVARKAKELGLSREALKKARISKLKEIFTLDPATHADEMRELVDMAATSTLEEVKARVRTLQEKDGREPMVYMTLKIAESAKETVKQALELARENYGDIETDDGEVKEASDSQCIEMIAVSYLQDPNNKNQEFTNGG